MKDQPDTESTIKTLEEPRDLLAQIMETSPAGIIMINRQGEIVYANVRAEKVLGLSREEITCRTYNDPAWTITDYEGNPLPDEELPFSKVITTCQAVNNLRHAIEWPNGQRVFLSINGAPLFDRSGGICGLVATVEDVTEEVLIKKALEESEERFRTIFQAIPDAVTLHAFPDGDYLEVNDGFVKLTGYGREEVIGKTPRETNVWHDLNDLKKLIASLGQDGLVKNQEVKFRMKDGMVRTGLISGMIIPFKEGSQFLYVTRDIEEIKHTEENLRTLSLMDELTGLYNRRGFFTLAEQALKTAQRMGKGMLLIYADLDDMKRINDAFGHNEGDYTLIEAGQVLKETFRQSDIIARIGGDEFVTLAMESDLATPEKLLSRLQEVIAERNAIKNRRYTFSLSIGVARFDPQTPCSVDELLTRGDQLMYANKNRSRNR